MNLKNPRVCPKCGYTGTLVVDTRPKMHTIYRRRKCPNCENQYYSYEYSISKEQKYAIDNLLTDEKESWLVTTNSLRDYLCIGETNDGNKIMIPEKVRYIKLNRDSEMSIEDQLFARVRNTNLPEFITKKLASSIFYVPFTYDNGKYLNSNIERIISSHFKDKRNLQCIGNKYVIKFNDILYTVDAIRGKILEPFKINENWIVGTRPIFIIK